MCLPLTAPTQDDLRALLARLRAPSPDTVRVIVVFASVYAATWLAAMTAAVISLRV